MRYYLKVFLLEFYTHTPGPEHPQEEIPISITEAEITETKAT